MHVSVSTETGNSTEIYNTPEIAILKEITKETPNWLWHELNHLIYKKLIVINGFIH